MYQMSNNIKIYGSDETHKLTHNKAKMATVAGQKSLPFYLSSGCIIPLGSAPLSHVINWIAVDARPFSNVGIAPSLQYLGRLHWPTNSLLLRYVEV